MVIIRIFDKDIETYVGALSTMSNDKLWYGYLEAGEKSSMIIRDLSIETDTSGYLFLFNMKSGQILRYKADIVESKLRDLTPEEKKKNKTKMLAAYKKASIEFKRPASSIQSTPVAPSPSPAEKDGDGDSNDDEALESMDSDFMDIDIDSEITDLDS